jgi:hypothetical protein
MTALESRKRLLIAESELNRAHLIGEWRAVKGEARALASRAKTISLMTSAAAALFAGVSCLRSPKSAPAAEKPSWWRVLLQGAGMVSSLWPEFRRQDRQPKPPATGGKDSPAPPTSC